MAEAVMSKRFPTFQKAVLMAGMAQDSEELINAQL
jgi:hypothetical protein